MVSLFFFGDGAASSFGSKQKPREQTNAANVHVQSTVTVFYFFGSLHLPFFSVDVCREMWTLFSKFERKTRNENLNQDLLTVTFFPLPVAQILFCANVQVRQTFFFPFISSDMHSFCVFIFIFFERRHL